MDELNDESDEKGSLRDVLRDNKVFLIFSIIAILVVAGLLVLQSHIQTPDDIASGSNEIVDVNNSFPIDINELNNYNDAGLIKPQDSEELMPAPFLLYVKRTSNVTTQNNISYNKIYYNKDTPKDNLTNSAFTEIGDLMTRLALLNNSKVNGLLEEYEVIIMYNDVNYGYSGN